MPPGYMLATIPQLLTRPISLQYQQKIFFYQLDDNSTGWDWKSFKARQNLFDLNMQRRSAPSQTISNSVMAIFYFAFAPVSKVFILYEGSRQQMVCWTVPHVRRYITPHAFETHLVPCACCSESLSQFQVDFQNVCALHNSVITQKHVKWRVTTRGAVEDGLVENQPVSAFVMVLQDFWHSAEHLYLAAVIVVWPTPFLPHRLEIHMVGVDITDLHKKTACITEENMIAEDHTKIDPVINFAWKAFVTDVTLNLPVQIQTNVLSTALLICRALLR